MSAMWKKAGDSVLDSPAQLSPAPFSRAASPPASPGTGLWQAKIAASPLVSWQRFGGTREPGVRWDRRPFCIGLRRGWVALCCPGNAARKLRRRKVSYCVPGIQLPKGIMIFPVMSCPLRFCHDDSSLWGCARSLLNPMFAMVSPRLRARALPFKRFWNFFPPATALTMFCRSTQRCPAQTCWLAWRTRPG